MASSTRPKYLQSSHLRHVGNGALATDQDATTDKVQPEVGARSPSPGQQEHIPVQRLFTVSVHDESFSREDIILNASNDDDIPMGELLRLTPLKGDGTFHHGKINDEDLDLGKQFVFVSKPMNQDLVSIQLDLQVSISRQIAQAFGFKKGTQALVSTAGEAGSHASHVEIIFRDQYLARADMWRLISAELANTCIFRAQRILFMGSIRATIKTIFVNGKKVPSAFFHSSTKPIFRSQSARYVLFIQMSKEMWDFDAEGSGEIMLDKVINGFLPELFKRWHELKVKHLVSIVLFTRIIYDKRKDTGLADSGLDTNEPHHRELGMATTSKDFYRVVVSDMASGEWANILFQLKKEFLVFLRDISIRPPNAGNHLPLGTGISSALADKPSHVIAGHPSAAIRGNVLEAINLASSQFSCDYIDRDLVRTGVSIVVISPSAGLFEVDYSLLVATTENLIENGVGIDLVCLSRMPLHSVPLFKYRIPPPGPGDAAVTGTRNTTTDKNTPKSSFSANMGIGAPLGSSKPDEKSLREAGILRGTKDFGWSYGVPHWVDISFWASEPDESGKQAAIPRKLKNKSSFDAPQHKAFVPRVRMYELQMMGVMENAISDISIEPLFRTFQSPSTFSQRPKSTYTADSPKTNSMYSYDSFRSSHTESPGHAPKLWGSPSSRRPSNKKITGPFFEWMDEYDDLVFRHPQIARKRARNTRPSKGLSKSRKRQEYSPSLLSTSANARHISSSHMKHSSDKERFLTQVMVERHTSQKKIASRGGLVGRTPSIRSTGPKKNLASRQISFGPRGFGASAAKAVASTEVSTDHGAASLSTLGLKSRFPARDAGRASNISAQVEQKKSESPDLRLANAKSADSALSSESESQQSSRPIPIRKGTAIRITDEGKTVQQPHDRDPHDNTAGVELHDRLAASKDIRDIEQNAPESETEDTDDAQPLPTVLSPSTTLAPWLTILNPSNPSKTTTSLASRLGRWHHIFPRLLRTSQIKWKSLCSPAAVPLTTEEFPSTEQLSEEYQESVYRVEVPEKRDLSETPRSLITELIAFRLSRGFQIVVGARLAESVKLPSIFSQPFNVFDEQVLTEDRNTIFLSRGSIIHQIKRSNDYKIEVKQFIRHDVVTARNADADSMLYKPSISSMLTVDYETQEISIAPPRADFDWKTIDRFIVGHERPKAEDFVDNLHPWRARFVLIPVETPTNTRRPLNSINEDDEEEIRLEGIRKLTQVWQRFRYVPPEERRFQAPLRNRKDTNPLDIMYQTRNPSTIVATELENVAEGDATGRPVQLLPESDLYQRSNFKISALAETVQSEKGVRMLDRRWHWRLHYNCFIGFELTTWLLQNFRDVDTRDEAVELGNDLMKSGMFKHVQQRHDFRDGNYFYQIADEYRTPRPESRGWFGRAKASVPSTPLSEDVPKDSTTTSRSRAGSTGNISEPTTPTGKKQKLAVALSKSLLYDVDHRKRSYRPEMINLHYDRLHNPDNCYHIRIEWMNTTAKLIQDTVTSWATSVDRFGLRLVEVPIGEASSITSMHPFRAPYRVKLKQQPPTKQPQSYFDNTSFFPQPKPQKHYYQQALLRRFEFVLDFEAGSDFPKDVNVTYSWGKPDYKYPQYIHRSGRLIAQITDEGDFLLLANRLYNNRGASANPDYKDGNRSDNPSDTDAHRGPGFLRSIPQRSSLSNLGGSPCSSPYSSPSVRAILDLPASTTNSTRGPSPSNNAPQSTNTVDAKITSASATTEAVKQAFEDFCNNKEALEKFYEEVLSKASTPGPNTPYMGGKTPLKGPMTPSRESEKLSMESSIPSLALPERLVGKRSGMEIGQGKGEKGEKKPELKPRLVGGSPRISGRTGSENG